MEVGFGSGRLPVCAGRDGQPHLPERNQELQSSKLKGPNPIVTKHAVHGSPPLPLCLFILRYTYSAHLTCLPATAN